MNATVTFPLQGQVALVTGATRGIGAAIAQNLAALGAQVVGTATSDEGAAKISAALANHAGCKGVRLDVTDKAAAEALVDQMVAEAGHLGWVWHLQTLLDHLEWVAKRPCPQSKASVC